MLAYNELRAGTTFMLEGQPYEVLEFNFLRMQQRKPVAQTKIKNLITGKIITRNFHMNESFEEAEIEKETVKFLYHHRDEYWFSANNNPAERFKITEATIGAPARFLKPNIDVTAVKCGDKIINVSIPIKMDLRVKEVPPGIRGDTAQGGTKTAVLETDATVSVPLFVNAGDTVRVNTDSGEYVERVEKSKE